MTIEFDRPITHQIQRFNSGATECLVRSRIISPLINVEHTPVLHYEGRDLIV